MLWILLLVLADPLFSLRTEPDGTLQIGRGNCNSAENEIDMSLDWGEPLEFAVGSTIKLCCSPNIPNPLDDTNVTVEWFYTTTENFGKFEDRVKNSSTKMIENYYKYPKDKSAIYDRSLLTINPLSMSDNGVFACLVNTTTLDAKIDVSMFLKWYKISVYNAKLIFKEQSYSRDITVSDEGYLTLSYALESYKCMCIENGVTARCDLVVDITASESRSDIQVINNLDNEELIVWLPKHTTTVTKLTATVYCPSDKASGLIRIWDITSRIYDRNKPKVMYRKMSETRLTLGSPSTAYCIGTCDQLKWSVLLGKEDGQSFETLTESAEIGKAQTKRFRQDSIKYTFTEVDLLLGADSTKSKFMKLSYTVSVDSSKSDTKGFDIALKCGCDGGSLGGFETASVTGTPTQIDGVGSDNCLGKDAHIPFSSKTFEVRRSPCCNIQKYLQDPVITTTLYRNGVKVDGGNETHYFIPAGPGTDVSAWYEANSGFYQCFVSGYQDHNGKLKMWSNIVDFKEQGVEEVQVLALNSTVPELTSSCPDYAEDECDSVYSKVRTLYENSQPSQRNHDILVLSGSCVQITVQIESHPKADVVWEPDPKKTFETFVNSSCDGNADQRGGSAGVNDKYEFEPYDLVTTRSTWFVKVTSSIEITASASKKQSFNFSVISEPVLEDINCTQSSLTVKCTVRGFPKPQLVFYSSSSGQLVTDAELRKCSDENQNNIEDHIEGTVVSVCREVYTTGDAKGFNIFATNGYTYNETVQEVEADANTDQSQELMLPLLILCLVLLVVVFIVIICCIWKRWKKRRGGKEYMELKEIDKMCYDYRTLNEAELVGQGNFGEVWRGWSEGLEPEGYRGKRTDIVIKKVKMIGAYDGLIDDLWREKDMLMKVRGHQNVALIFGYSKGPPAIVIEYCPLGSLDKLLKESRKFKTTEGNDGYAVPDEMLPLQRLTFKSTEILDFGRQIATGMDWIGSKGIIHRDLAARNVVVAQEHSSYIMKIIDFGLARLVDEEGLYIRKEGRQIPVKWIAPESFNDEYTIMSDVWSFGVTLWEIVTLGAEPYHNIPNRELMPRLKHGYRLPKPAICEENLYRVMENCWQLSPDNRPKFNAIVTELEASLEDSGNYLAPDIYTNNLDITHFMDAATLDAATAAAGFNLNNFNCNENNENSCDNTPKSPPKSPPMKNVYSPEPLAENVTITPNSNLNVNNHNLRKQALSNNVNLDSDSGGEDPLDPMVMPLV